MKRRVAAPKLRIVLSFEGRDTALHDVFVMSRPYNDHHAEAKVLAQFDQISLAELATLEFIVAEGQVVDLLAASAATGHVLDLAMVSSVRLRQIQAQCGETAICLRQYPVGNIHGIRTLVHGTLYASLYRPALKSIPA